MVWRAGLLGIGGDDFEVAAGVQFRAARLAEREESIARAASRMDAAECGRDAGVLFDEGDTAIEIAAAEKDMIEHGGRPFFLRGKQRAGTNSRGGEEDGSR